LSWLILAKGLWAVNGKSVPFAHNRNPIGYPESLITTVKGDF
jgi:hypothetical protein